MAVDAVVSVVIQKLTDMLIEEPVVFDKVIDKVEEIRIKLRRMRGFLIDAEENEGPDKSAKKWADDYLRILYCVEDNIETFALRIASHRWKTRMCNSSSIGDVFNNYACLFFFFNNLKASKKLRWKMASIETEIDELNKRKPGMVRDASFKYHFSDSSFQGNSFHHHEEEEEEEEGEEEQEEEEDEICEAKPVKTSSLGSSFGEHLRRPTLTSSFSNQEEEEEDLGLVGFPERVDALVKRLTSDTNNNNILSIVGEVGSGKTTLAQAIYKSKEIKSYFKGGRAWVSVSKDYTERDVLLSLLKQVDSSKKQDQGVVLNPQQVLANKLAEKKFFVVMDGVRTCDAWEKLKDAFPNPNTGNGTKIILITCDERVALSAGGSDNPPHCMERLSREESWKMFLKKARLSEIPTTESDSDILDLQRRILEICERLPLKIVLLGGLLSTKKISYDEWSRVLDHIDGHGFDILSLCYNDLPVHSKLCLLYLVLFPKEFDIPVRRLVRLWLAEGFVKRSPTPLMTTEQDVAGEYFDDLVNRNLIQISKFRSDGSPRRCHLPSALHDYLLPKAEDISLFHVHRSNSDCNMEETGGRFGLRRIVEYLNLKNCAFNDSELQYLRSYISFNIQRKDIPAIQVANFVSKITGNRGYGLLRVLDLEGVYKPSLPDKLGDLFHLRYLGLRWTFLDNLPPSVGDLPYLETLDLKRTYINSLPNSIWKLEHLRHLNLNEIRLDMPEQQHSPLPGLLTLWGLFVDDKSSVKNGLSKLHDLRELGISFNLKSSLDLTEWISNLTNLQSLRLRSKDERGRPSKLDLKPLSALGKLSHLNLLGNLQKLPAKHEFPPGLKVLTLSVSQLTEDPMPTLGQLQNLTVLRLLANSFLGEKIVCPLRGFSKLRVLKLWMLKSLKEWDVKEGAMQNLKELNIRCCDNLRTLPPTLLQLSTLEEVILTNMPKRFVTEVQEQKSDHTTLTENNLPFTPLPWEEEEEEDNVCHINGNALLMNGQAGHSETSSQAY
ncbi:unnamed protein product [Camellia sinensis]